MDALNDLIENRPRRGFWKCFKLLRRQGRGWNHKRVYRVYCQMGLNRKRRAKPRVPSRHPEPLSVPGEPNQVWSADFMSDSLYGGNRFRIFNVMDHFNREAVAIEIDTSITGSRLIRVFGQLQAERGLPSTLRVDNVLTAESRPGRRHRNPECFLQSQATSNVVLDPVAFHG